MTRVSGSAPQSCCGGSQPPQAPQPHGPPAPAEGAAGDRSVWGQAQHSTLGSLPVPTAPRMKRSGLAHQMSGVRQRDAYSAACVTPQPANPGFEIKMGIIFSTLPQVLQLLARCHGDGRCAEQLPGSPAWMRPVGMQSGDRPPAPRGRQDPQPNTPRGCSAPADPAAAKQLQEG